jgi:hypothetical protein
MVADLICLLHRHLLLERVGTLALSYVGPLLPPDTEVRGLDCRLALLFWSARAAVIRIWRAHHRYWQRRVLQNLCDLRYRCHNTVRSVETIRLLLMV